jgi:hypothetical protein
MRTYLDVQADQTLTFRMAEATPQPGVPPAHIVVSTAEEIAASESKTRALHKKAMKGRTCAKYAQQAGGADAVTRAAHHQR